MTPHVQKNFRTTSKSENHMQNNDGMQKKLKMHAVSMTPHAHVGCKWFKCGRIQKSQHAGTVTVDKIVLEFWQDK
jgi:hypothetical protein